MHKTAVGVMEFVTISREKGAIIFRPAGRKLPMHIRAAATDRLSQNG